ncbi:diguanylate cyclase domain-containing protein [Desulfoluna spongiiphila]|uniref:Diguanylate cyclase (GGDEF) domain-containing protein n=1 Tax=Desulfoluna spongiiphila TaxID=419481 RepID=A0A1G5IJL7_9BACT|nr:diguanylate cyclase [Desulfoluna spongiiphila]SCY76203.1 diguanylate cyclase (GGDEF) domain-containing protein [Desulfoluna spongiiphila]
MNYRPTGSWVTPAIPLLLFALLLGTSQYIALREQQHLHDVQYRRVYEHAGAVRTQLEVELNTTLNLCLGLVAVIKSEPDFPVNTFESVAESIMAQATHIRSIALAKDNVITHIFPTKGNEKALGLHYADVPAQWAAITRAMEHRHALIAGPITLIQGGRAFVSRIPIYPRDNVYWGVASVSIDEESLYRFSGLLGPDPTVRYALKGKDGLGEAGEVFHGDPQLFSDPRAAILPVKLPMGTWILAAVPSSGWIEHASILTLIRWSGLLLALVISSLVCALLHSYRRIHLIALQDPLTGLSNRRLLEEHLSQLILLSRRKKRAFTLLYVDLDRFKPINDRFGHEAGDAMLTTLARRLKDNLRQSDIIARVGGDEFILLFHDMVTRRDADAMASKVGRIIEAPVALSCGQKISVGASIGTSLYPDDGTSGEALISHADLAMYEQKSH